MLEKTAKDFYMPDSIRTVGETMGIGKILIGLIFVIIGIWAVMPEPWGYGLIDHLIRLLAGIVPLLLIFIGLILVWIEAEELKIAKPKKKRRR
ncbi:MAG: hypothetical protein V1818_00835 [Candidatus Aenigmatarchaeota archaeon]